MLEVKNLTSSIIESGITDHKFFKIDDVSFTLEDGYICALLGKNGSGKTTLLDLMYGNVLVKSGSVSFDGVEFNKKTRAKFRNDVALISNGVWYFADKSVSENVALLSIMYEGFDEKLFMEYMKRFEFPETDFNKPVSKLSTGQKVQFDIAFAAARRPKLMLMDEPFANLDPVVKVDIMEIIQDLVSENNMSVIISTHLLDEIDNVVDYVAVIDDGKLVKYGDRVSLIDSNNYKSIEDILINK